MADEAVDGPAGDRRPWPPSCVRRSSLSSARSARSPRRPVVQAW